MEYSRWTGQRSRRTEPEQVRRKPEMNHRGNAAASGRHREWSVRGADLKAGLQGMCAWIKRNRKMQLILLLSGVLVIGGVTKGVMNRFLYREADITEAFLATDSGCLETRLQITADYGSDFLTEHDKQELLRFLANALGVQMEGNATATENDVSQIYTYTKQAKQAETTFKVVTLKENSGRTYLYTELVIYEDNQYDILAYRDQLLKALKELAVVRVETTLQFLGAYEGQLAMSEWDRISDRMIKKLDGKIIYENRDPDLYTVYAYSAGLPEYITSNGKQINIQVAMRYEEDNDRTIVYLATPMIRGDW